MRSWPISMHSRSGSDCGRLEDKPGDKRGTTAGCQAGQAVESCRSALWTTLYTARDNAVNCLWMALWEAPAAAPSNITGDRWGYRPKAQKIIWIGRSPLVDIRVTIGPKKGGTGRANAQPPFENAVYKFDYFSEELIALKLVLNAVPTPFTAVMIAIAIPAAINAYSMAVAADSSR